MTKKPAGPLTITKATSQGRRAVDKVMPNTMSTVESKGSWDLDTDTARMVTTITFPAGHPNRALLAQMLTVLVGVVKIEMFDTRITLVRTR